jgi:hypothetical protein
MFLVVFGDIHKDDLQSIFPYAIIDITNFNEKILIKQRKNCLENISTNLTLWLDGYQFHNKQFVEIISLSKFSIL